MTRLFEKFYPALNGQALRDFAALCAASGSYFGEALVEIAQNVQPDDVMSPKWIAGCCYDAWGQVAKRMGDSDSPTPVGFELTEWCASHGGGRTKARLGWIPCAGPHIAIDVDCEEILKHAKCAWQEALGLPVEEEICRAAVAEYGQEATATVDWDWSDFDNIEGYTNSDWQDWAKLDLAWRADHAGLTGRTPHPRKPELPANAKRWAEIYATTYAAKRRRPAKRIVIRRTTSSACEQAGLAHPTSRPEDRP